MGVLIAPPCAGDTSLRHPPRFSRAAGALLQPCCCASARSTARESVRPLSMSAW